MRDWSLRAGDPLSLTISADMRLCSPDYLNDHSWEVSLGGGEPPAISVRTAYGLRARNMRIFYRFTEAGKSITDPAAFPQAVCVRRFYPNYVRLVFVPIEGLEVTAEYWVPQSHVLAGRLTLVNRTAFPRHVDAELCGTLNPLDGKAFGPARQQQMVRVLSGATGGLQPVLFSEGSPRQGTGPHSGLRLVLDFDGGAERSFNWACAAEASDTESFGLARRTAALNWEAERTRVELVNAADSVEIHTGDADWDAALAFAQKDAQAAFFPGGAHLPKPSFVRTRGPDNGFSRGGDASDYSTSWNGQSALDAYYVSGVLPGAPELRGGLLENYMSVQAPDGSIDARPGLAGQRSRFLAAPFMAVMAWQHHQRTQDTGFLERVFPRLSAFFDAWFASAQDRDGDGIPEWEHVLQTGLDENPLFDVWYPWSQALSIQTLLNPELEALLLHEGRTLTRIAEVLGRQQETSEIQRRTKRLSEALDASWSDRVGGYAYRDQRTGASWTDRLVGSRKGSGEILPRHPECEQPVRLLIQVHTKSAAARRPAIEIFGSSQVTPRTARRKPAPAGGSPPAAGHEQSEAVPAANFQWRSGGLVAVSALVYGRVERVVVDGLDEKDRVVVRTVNTSGEDITLFTPLWAGSPDVDRARVMVRRLMQDEQGFRAAVWGSRAACLALGGQAREPRTARGGGPGHERAPALEQPDRRGPAGLRFPGRGRAVDHPTDERGRGRTEGERCIL